MSLKYPTPQPVTVVIAPLTGPLELKVPRIAQLGDEWCWAACAQMVLAFYKYPAPTPQQCEMANLLFRFRDCCHTPRPLPGSHCDQGCAPAPMLNGSTTSTGVVCDLAQRRRQPGQLDFEISHGRPVEVRMVTGLAVRACGPRQAGRARKRVSRRSTINESAPSRRPRSMTYAELPRSRALWTRGSGSGDRPCRTRTRIPDSGARRRRETRSPSGCRGCSGRRLLPTTTVVITSSFEVWGLSLTRRINRRASSDNLDSLAAPTGRWHHQIALDGQPELYARGPCLRPRRRGGPSGEVALLAYRWRRARRRHRLDRRERGRGRSCQAARGSRPTTCLPSGLVGAGGQGPRARGRGGQPPRKPRRA